MIKHPMKKRTTLVAAVAGAGLVVAAAFALGGSSASAEGTAPPWVVNGVDQDPDAVGGLSFFDANGTAITSGQINNAPFAAYVEGRVAPRVTNPTDTKATLYMYIPVAGQTPDGWTTNEQVSLSTTYPNASAPGALATATLPVTSGSAADDTALASIASDEGATSTASGYQNIYEIRMYTNHRGGTTSATYDYADLTINRANDTWALAYTPGNAVVVATTTSTTLAASPAATAIAGAPVALTATVSPSTAAGTVQFMDGSTAIGSPVSVTGGVAHASTTALSLGSHSLTAAFTPMTPASFTASTSTPLTYSITSPAVSTSTSLGVTPTGPIVVGTSSTLTATITPSNAAGSVQFKDGGTAIGSPVAVSSGSAQTTTSLALGAHSLTAVFSPTSSADFSASTSTATPYQVNPVPAAPTTTMLAVGPSSPAAFGATVTLTGTVTPSNAAGTIQFLDGSTAIGSPVAVAGGTAQTTTTTLASGSHSLKAEFLPANASLFGASTSSASTYVISPRATTVSLGESPASGVNAGTSVHLTATLTPSVAAGTVQFTDGGSPLGSPVTVAGGTATLVTSSLSIATHTLSATFTPTNASQFTSATATPVSYTVVKPPAGATTTTLAVTPASPILTTAPAVTLTATIAPSTATGRVQFMDGSTAIGAPVTVSGGKATFSTTGAALGAGTHSLSAAFTSSDVTTFLDSSSATSTLVVNPPPVSTTTTLTTSPTTAEVYAPVVLSAAVTPSTATGTVRFTDGGVAIGSPVAVSGGAASITTTFQTTGTQALAAVFTPASLVAFTGSTGTASFAATAAVTTSNVTASDSASGTLGDTPSLEDGSVVMLQLNGLDSSVSTLDVTLHSTPTSLGTVAVSASGKASYTLTVPTALPAGAHTLVFTDPGSGAEVAVFTFTATAIPPVTPSNTPSGTATSPAPASTTPAAPSQPLAATGNSTADQLLVAFVLIGLGGAMLLALRRRRPSGAHR
ncbi:MAG TPA: Ig-like domain-containing protein [Jatrophihabitantaceae bacterium]|nr:Ig-like domain-containing protein [Jatrophihabitantaceae bacterium]